MTTQGCTCTLHQSQQQAPLPPECAAVVFATHSRGPKYCVPACTLVYVFSDYTSVVSVAFCQFPPFLHVLPGDLSVQEYGYSNACLFSGHGIFISSIMSATGYVLPGKSTARLTRSENAISVSDISCTQQHHLLERVPAGLARRVSKQILPTGVHERTFVLCRTSATFIVQKSWIATIPSSDGEGDKRPPRHEKGRTEDPSHHKYPTVVGRIRSTW